MEATVHKTAPLLLWTGILLHVLVTGCHGYILDGSSTCYLQFPSWNFATNGSLKFDFRTEKPIGLLVYMDGGGGNGGEAGGQDFVKINLISGAVQLHFRTDVDGLVVVRSGQNLNDGLPHHVEVVRSGAMVYFVVDKEKHNLRLNSKDLNFGNPESNSDVYSGGIPSGYKIEKLALPSIVFEKHFGGSILETIFNNGSRDIHPQLIGSAGLRYVAKNRCEYENPCKHGGVCISTDTGAICECTLTDYTGEFCETGRNSY